MIRLSERVLFTLTMCLFSVLILSLSADLGRVARMVPLAVAIPTLLLLILQLCMDLMPGLAEGLQRWEKADLFKVEPLRAASSGWIAIDEKDATVPLPRRERIALLWLAALGGLVYLLGLLPGLPCYILLYWKNRLKAGWLPSAAAAAGILILLYLLLVQVLDFPLYHGLCWDWLTGASG